jgi:hypothetical protein
MTERTRGVQLLTIPTVTVTVLDPDCLFALDMKGIAHRTNRVERKARYWRGLRSRLFDLGWLTVATFRDYVLTIRTN